MATLALAAALSFTLAGAAYGSGSQLLSNGGFEGSGSGSLSGWAPVSSSLSLASDGVGGGHAGRASFNGTASFGIKASPVPVSRSTAAGTVYTAGAMVRSATPGKKACLRVIEVSSSGASVGAKSECVTTQSGWQAFPGVTYTAQAGGDTIALRIVQSSSVSGTSFEVDNVTLSAGSVSPGPAAPTSLSVTGVTSSEVDLSWTRSSGPNVVSYRVNRNGAPLATFADPGTSTITYHDTAVSSSSSYSYTVQAIDSAQNASAPSNTVTATTLSSGGGGGDVTIGAVGDMACNPSNPGWNGGNGLTSICGQKRTSAAMLADHSLQFILGLGDYQYDCDESDAYAASYTPTWGRLTSLIRPVVGNHEYNQGTDKWSGEQCPSSNATAQPYFNYFGAASHPATSGHFSFNAGSWHIIGLNGECSKPVVGGCAAADPEGQFLQQDLSSNRQPCILAYWHEPLWTSTPTNQPRYAPWWNILYSAHADLVLNGHVHNYSRFNQLNPSGAADANGIREVIVGTGGEDLGGGNQSSNPAPAVQFHTFGYLRLTLRSSSYAGSFISSSGATLDSFSGSCH